VRALITGANGFAGRHLVGHLTDVGDEVVGLIRPGTTSPPGVRAVEVDIRETDAVARLVADVHPDVIYHLAALTHVGASWGQRRETLDVNVMGAFSVLEGARRCAAPPRVVLIGSSEVYGRAAGPERPLVETEPVDPSTPYGVSKAAQELLGRQYARADGLRVVMVRAFNHTGPGQEASFVVPEWAKQIAAMEAKQLEPRLTVGNLDVSRDFSDVRDIVRLYRLLALKGQGGEVYNACSGVARSLAEILDRLRDHALVSFEVETDPERMRPVDRPVVVGSCEKAQRATGWRRQVPFERTVAAVLDDWRRRVRRGE